MPPRSTATARWSTARPRRPRASRAMVDAEVAGARAYDFQPWYAALMGRITGTASYCTYAVSRTDAFVASEEALIAANQRADRGRRQLPRGRPDHRRRRARLRLVPRLDDRRPAHALDRLRQPGGVERVALPDEATWGSTSLPVERLVGRQPGQQLLLLVPARDDAARARHLRRDTRRPRPGSTSSATTKIEDQLVPTFERDLVGGGSREGTGYGTAMMSLFAPVRPGGSARPASASPTLTPHTLASMLAHDAPDRRRRSTASRPTGDHARDSTAALFDYHRDYLQVLMRLFPTDRARRHAPSRCWRQSSVPRMANSFMYYSDFLYDQTRRRRRSR